MCVHELGVHYLLGTGTCEIDCNIHALFVLLYVGGETTERLPTGREKSNCGTEIRKYIGCAEVTRGDAETSNRHYVLPMGTWYSTSQRSKAPKHGINQVVP